MPCKNSQQELQKRNKENPFWKIQQADARRKITHHQRRPGQRQNLRPLAHKPLLLQRMLQHEVPPAPNKHSIHGQRDGNTRHYLASGDDSDGVAALQDEELDGENAKGSDDIGGADVGEVGPLEGCHSISIV